jgi:hypothetical protein
MQLTQLRRPVLFTSALEYEAIATYKDHCKSQTQNKQDYKKTFIFVSISCLPSRGGGHMEDANCHF